MRRHDRALGVDAVARHRERGQDAHRLAGFEAVHAGAQRLHDRSRLVAEPGRKPCLLHVAAAAKRCLRAVHADRLDAHPHLDFAGLGDLERFEAEDLGPAEVADRGYVLENGRIAGEGTARRLIEDPAVRSAYLGMGSAPAEGAMGRSLP